MTRLSQSEVDAHMARMQGYTQAPDTPDKGSESELQKKCIQYCKHQGWPVFHDRSRHVNEPGWPDLTVYLPNGKTVLVELKAKAGKLRKEQKELKLRLHFLGHTVHVVKSFKKFVSILEG